VKESDLQKLVLDWLVLHRIFHRRKNTGAMASEDVPGKKRFVRFGQAGDPDIEICYKGRFIAVELKSETGTQTQNQKNYQSDFEAAGGRYILARSLEDVTEVLK
jgi:hypothetical protein